mmetsp:Transcript_6455/g.17437  ORF Transcript_6455/g.17437 Transcript_6455/m.17437 type:complete len:201 (-) Transcript_6455:11-613(-)
MSRKSSLLMSPLFGSSSAKSSSTPQSSSYFRQPNMVRNCSSRINRTSSLINQSSWHLNFQTKAISLRIRCQFGSFSSSANSSSPMVSMVSSSPSPAALAMPRPRLARRRAVPPASRSRSAPHRPCSQARLVTVTLLRLPRQRDATTSAIAVQVSTPKRPINRAWLHGLLDLRPLVPAEAWLARATGSAWGAEAPDSIATA